MNKKILLLFVLLASMAFTLASGPTATAWHTENHGYFYGKSESGGWWNVWPSWGGSAGCAGDGWAIPGWVRSADQFIDFTLCKLNGNTQEHVGAAFIISTMSGMSNIDPGATEINEFVARVRAAELKGWMNPDASDGCSLPNTFYQSTRHDIAYEGSCATGGNAAITFWNGSSNYIIKRFCANPVGTMAPLQPAPEYNMTGFTTLTNLTSGARGANPYPGDKIQFDHFVRNNGPGSTWPFTTIWSVAEQTSPSYAVVGGPNDGGYYGPGEQKLRHTHQTTIPAGAVPGTQYCERVGYDPVNGQGGRDGRGTPVCAKVAYNFTLTPSINAVITSGGVPITGNFAQPGDTITFTYAVNNSGLTVSQSTVCTYKSAINPGYNQAAPTTTFTPSGGGVNCPPARTFPGNGATTTVFTEVGVPASAVNTTICRSLTVSPATPGGGSSPPVQACVAVANKPYARVYGGDVVAGGGLESAPDSHNCTATNNLTAAIIGWNKGGTAPNNYGGAGVQYAAMALGMIFDTATSLGNAAGSGLPPTALSFGNTVTNVANRQFGGRVGAVPCIPDRYPSPAPSGAPLGASTSFTAASDGIYTASGNLTINASTIATGKHVTVYATGNVFISGAITLGGGGTWTSGTIPSFRLVVKGGNILVGNDVARLDGLYVAQPSGGAGGSIYTCALATQPYVPLVPSAVAFASNCNHQTLTVNGAFSAKRVYLYRTKGTVGQSDASNLPGHPSQAEVFNYSPALWMYQPSDNASPADYDAIVSLPPIL